MRKKRIFSLLLIATSCFLCTCLRFNGIWAVLFDAALLAVAIVFAVVAKRNRFFVLMSIFLGLVVLWALSLIFDLKTELFACREMRIALCASSDVVMVDGDDVDYEEFKNLMAKDFVRHGVARKAKISLESGCLVSNIFRLCEVDAELLLSREYILDAYAMQVVFKLFPPWGLNDMSSKDILMFIVDAGGNVGKFFYRLDSIALDQWCDLAAKNIGVSSHCSVGGRQPTKLEMHSIDELATIRDTHRGDIVLVMDQKMQSQLFCRVLLSFAKNFAHEKFYIMPLASGIAQLAEKLSWNEKDAADIDK